MTKAELARQLRERQLAKGLTPKSLLDLLDDDEIIDCYVTCAECGAKQAEGEQLERIIAERSDAEEFFELCNAADERGHRWVH